MKEIGITLALLAVLVGGMMFFSRDESDKEQEIVDEEVASAIDIIDEQETNTTNDELPSAEFIDCLADSGMVVYASRTCPACTDLANSFGGYDAVENLFVECSEQPEVCQEYAKTGYVPEIQFEGEVFEGGRSMEDFAALTGCEL